ncbi:3',5'-nucleoside bisphosphate phosphatase [Roseateles sp. DC23W]|uniref:3',5'-nucleoside bisphosphate phosphatase n=1 Tax=Pelomonas dachongensis TaxID=3299029 RepID=A0ABW7ESM4_9BURK
MNLDAALNADLHCHSVISDGTLTPEELAGRAAERGVQLWSLTDHDEIAGQARAIAAARAAGMAYLTGTEISVTFAGRVVHIVGLGFDHTAPEMINGLRATRGGREARARDMAASLLAEAGIAGAFEGALKYVGNPELISRTHFARFLVDAGHCADIPEVFRRFLTEGKPGFVQHRWAALKDAVGWIHRAGGVAVIAHPGRYDFTPTEEYALITEFMAHGGRGIEVVTGSHTTAEFQQYADTAEEFGLLASRGSDFHSPEESRVDLGALPPLAGKLSPVWAELADRIHA